MSSSAAVVHHDELRTRDRDLAVEAINGIVAHQAKVTFEDPAAVDLRVRSSTYGAFGAHLIRAAGVRYVAATDPMDFLACGFVAEGGALVRMRGREVALPRDEGFLHPVGEPSDGEYGNTSVALVRLPVGLTAEVAEAATGVPAADLRFESMTPVSASMRRYWAATAAYVCRQLTTSELDVPPLMADQLVRLTVSALLTVFPNTTMTMAHLPGTGRVAPAVVRRAVAFVDGHADKPMTVADIAAAAGIGPRALQEAFRRHLDITPMAYLRRVRLERVHRDLQTANPAAGATVAAIARRWGFGSLSRFAGDYRTSYGQSPSRTLHT
ncbi:helix-turn-helix domain-containing protein [Phytohabitans kaempferiae]|uniref:Helix-turn-helix domain-containing protein n=1 Tax=Phytohabitans kaempferiae TaxID=1620943 RepID=A0ABV6LYR3_9ACTN